jgi:opacity protein-like surface antigen
MKKIIYTLALGIFLIPFTSNAQGIGIGIKAGANFANQNIKDVSTESITDFHVGGYVNIMFSEKFGLTPELLYTAHGSKIEDAEISTDYIAIPLMLRWKPISLISIQAGPQFSFLTNAESNDFENVKDQLENNDFGLAVGAGVHLPLGLNVGIRYVWGFSNISKATTQKLPDNIKNRTFQLYVGWTLFGQN